jgi:hypothetical protein
VSAADDPWALYPSDYDDAWQTRRNAINAGLRACGYPIGDDAGGDPYYGWPWWASIVYHAFPASMEVLAVRVLAEGRRRCATPSRPRTRSGARRR